jgi:hypothetical protein
VLISEGLNFTTERLDVSFGRGQLRRELVVQNMKLTAEDLDSLLDIGKGVFAGRQTAFLASVDFVETSCQSDEAGDR